MQAFNGPRCDLYDNILVHGCSSKTVITAKSSMRIEQVSSLVSVKFLLTFRRL